MNTETMTAPPPAAEDEVMPNGMTPRRWKEVLAYIEEKNKDPEYRRQINAEVNRQLDACDL